MRQQGLDPDQLVAIWRAATTRPDVNLFDGRFTGGGLVALLTPVAADENAMIERLARGALDYPWGWAVLR